MTVEKRFEKYCNFIAFISVYFVAAGLALPFFAELGNFLFTLFGFVAVFTLMLSGYGLQALICRLTGFRRRQDDGIYESNVRYFNLPRAAMAVMISAICGFFIHPIFDKLYFNIAMETPGMVYDQFSVMPIVLTVALLAFVIVGAVVWFYPFQRFALLRFPFVCIPILIIEFVISLQFGGFASVCTAICLFGFVLCSFILMNQGTISRRYGSEDMVSFMNGRSRIYNIAMTGMLLPLLLVVAGLAYIIIGGLTVLGRLGLLTFFMVTTANAEEYKLTGSNVSGYMFGVNPGERAAYSTSFTLFLLIGTLILIFITMRKTNWVRSFVKALKRWFDALLEFILSLSGLELFKRYSEDEDLDVSSFKDEEKLHQRAVINPYVKKAEATKSYRDFVIKLNGFRYDEDKVQFAYTTLITQLYRGGKFIKRADTPRQIANKLKSDPIYQGIDGITEAFEIVAYADRDLNAERAEQAIATLCRLLRHHLS